MIKADAIRNWIVLLFVLGATGCAVTSPPVSFYALSSLSDQGQGLTTTGGVPAIGVGPVMLPDYLDRPQLVTLIGPNQMRVDEYHRWAGALDRAIVRTVAQNLMTLLGSDRIMPIPWPSGFNPDIIVRLEVYAFESTSDGATQLRATVELSDRRPDSASHTWNVDLKEQADSRTYEAMVAAQSRLLAQLSRQIAERIVGKIQ